MQVEKITLRSIKKAIKIMQKSGTVIYPTETSYGLGCDWTNKKAIAKIFKIKKRPKKKKMAVICASKAMVNKFFKMNSIAKKIASKFWPGPLSIVLNGTATRVSSNKTARALSRGLKKPIVSTSANISGKSELYNIKMIIKSFEKQKYQPDLILDAGTLPKNKPSTIVKIENNKVKIMRKGKICL